ncbi:MAG: DUF5011 domain-containing protein [Agarilytica sp.]
MKRLDRINKWLAAFALGTTTIGTAAFSASAFSQTPFQEFLERAESQQFNTSILSRTENAPASVQMLFGKSAMNIQLNSQALFNLSDFKIELPGLENLHAVKERVIANKLGGNNWVGDVVFLDPTGYETEKEGRAYFVETAKGITGTIHTKNEVIQIYPDGAGGQIMISSDPSEFDSEGQVLAADNPVGDEPAGGPSIGGRIDGQSPASPSNPYTVDVLWVVTEKAVNNTSVDVPAAIELAMTHTNDAYANSNINGRVRTVHVHYDTSYTEGSSMTDTLYAVRDPSDGNMDNIHALRTQYGADMVHIVSGSGNYCGQAWLDTQPDWTFAVTYAGCMSSYTPAHEFGHNFGAHHDIANGTNSNYVFGQGIYNETDDPKWRTVMSYQCPAGGCTRVPYFTTPEQTYNGAPLGDPLEADNTRVHRVRMAQVAGFYPSVASSCTEFADTNANHVTAGRAYTETVFFTTTYYATGSGDNLGNYSFINSTLAEESPGYFSSGNCPTTPTSSETAFAPELQNLNPTAGTNTLIVDGEVFDANADTITAVKARINGETTWTDATISSNTFNVSIPATLGGSTLTVDFRTEDNTGESFEFTTTFDVDLGVPPQITLSGSNFRDDTAVIYGTTNDPDNSVNELFYQLNGSGDPAVGTWTSFPVDTNYWTLITSSLPVGTNTVHVYGVDETGLQSNVISAQVTTIPLEAPACNFLGVSPSTSQVAGEIDINGLVSDANQSDVTLEFQVNGGTWTAFGSYDLISSEQPWTVKLPDTYADASVLNVNVRANDSSGLSTNCGSDTYTVVYSGGNETPSCEIINIEQIEGSVVFNMFITDPDGDPQSIYGKESSQTEWAQFWPSVVSRNGLPVPGIGNFTIEGRVVDVQGNEGFCSANITINDSQFVPEVSFVQGNWESEVDSVILNTRVNDWDGDIVSVETRPVGGSWAAMSKVDIWGNYTIDLGLLADGNYDYEVRATDSGGRVSDTFATNFDVERQVAPTLQNITWSQSGTTVTVSGEAIDANNNMRRVYFELDGADSIYDNVTGSAWSHNFEGLSLGQHSVVITAEDTWGMQSAPFTLDFEVTAGSAPTFTNINVSIVDENTVRIDVSGTDVNGDLESLQVTRDGSVSLGYANTGFDTWIIQYPNQSVGVHTLDLYLEDSQGNTSVVESRTYEIQAPVTPCFEDTNANHEAAGRATTTEVCSFEWLGNCYGTITTTWYAVGSNDNLGTNGSTTNSLLESSTGYYELGACNDSTPPTITLAGSNPMDVYQGATYVEPGFTAIDNIDGDISVSVGISGNVDTSIVGAYQLTYNVSDSSGNAATPVVRTVNVVADDVKPVISISGGTSYTVNVGNSFSNPSADATDNVDGNISGNVVVTGTVDTNAVGTYNLYYNVSDAAGNAADEVVVTVDVQEEQDTTPPVITLSGDAVINLDLNDPYTDPGYFATDNTDGDITTNVVVGGDVVDTSSEGTYVVTYNVSDAAGNPAVEQTRTVNVVDPSGGACFSNTLNDHINAGRAEVLYGSNIYTVVPAGQTNEYLGSTVINMQTVVSLEEQSTGHWVKVTACN